jgi:hypothetical protein
MVGKYRHLGVNEDEAARLLMSGITTIPRLGATVGPNDTRRGWWLDYYLRGGQVNRTMRDEMNRMGIATVDDFFVKTSERETNLRNKRKATQTQYSMAAVAIVTTAVTCGAGGAVGAALLGTVGVAANTVSFGAFVAGAVAVQGVSSAATAALSHGDLGDFARSWAVGSAAGIAGYGAGYGAARVGLDANLQLASQSAAGTFVSSGARTVLEGGGFKSVFRDSAVSFAAGGVMGTFTGSASPEARPESFGDYLSGSSASTFSYLHAVVSKGLQGGLHAVMYGGNIGEAALEKTVSRETITDYLMAVAAAPVGGWIASELVAALPGHPTPKSAPPAFREPTVESGTMEAFDAPGSSGTPAARWARGGAATVADHVREIASAPVRALAEMADTATQDSWLKRSRLVNPFSRSFAGYQVLDKTFDAARVAAGLPFSFLSGDFMESQPDGDMTFDGHVSAVSFNGILNSRADAETMKQTVGQQIHAGALVQVRNGTHGYGLGDLMQIVGNELGVVDITAIRGAQALRRAAAGDGMIQVVAHSQGTMTFRRGLDLVDESAIRQRIVYQGGGSEMAISQQALGLASADNLWNRQTGSFFLRDWVPAANFLPTPARMLSAPFMTPGREAWRFVDAPGNVDAVLGQRHGFVRNYAGGMTYGYR